MILALLLFLQAAVKDTLVLEKGAALYTQRCSVPYCHGPAGTPGRAPALAGRNFDPAALRTMIAEGIPSRGMPAFQTQLGDEGISAVLAYIRSLPAPPRATPSAPTTIAAVRLSKEATAGRDLFLDSSRLPGCSDCHAVGNMGATVAAKLTGIANLAALRAVRATHVQTAQIPNEPDFPALLAQVTSETMRVFDLSMPIPVLRTFAKSQITLKEGANWDHAAVVKRYSPAELELILAFIRAR
jgi:mono/diheme cytochrome c family protein